MSAGLLLETPHRLVCVTHTRLDEEGARRDHNQLLRSKQPESAGMDNTQNTTQPKEKTEQEPLWVPETEQYRQWIIAQEAKKQPAPRACIAAVIIITIMAAFLIMIFLLKSRDIEEFELDEAGNTTDILLASQYNDTVKEPGFNGGSNVFIHQ